MKPNRTAAKSTRKTARNRDSRGEAAHTPVFPSQAIRHILIVGAIIAVAFIAYSNSFHAPFLLDNEDIILRDQRVHAFTSVQFHRILTEQYWETAPTGLYRPLTTMSYLLNYALLGNGTDPEGYHWINFLLHAGNIALVYALALALFKKTPAALLAAAIWGLHPVLTESVTNIVGRADLLAAFGVLSALLCHHRALRASGIHKAAWLAAMALAVTAGMFSKESAIVVVAVLPFYDLSFGRETGWRSRLPGYLAAGLPCLAYLYVRAYVLAHNPYLATQFGDNPLLGARFWTARITAVKVIGRYFGLLLWPARLSYDYSYNAVPLFGWGLNTAGDWMALAAAVACLAIAVAAIRSYRRHPAVFFSVVFFFVTLAPTSNLLMVIGSIMAERFLYLPSVGFVVCAVAALAAWRRRLPLSETACRYTAVLTCSVLLIALGARTYARNQDWLDERRFWRSGVEAAPGSYKTNLNAATGTRPLSEGDWSRGIREADRALAILAPLPDDRNAPNAYRDAGTLYRSVGEHVASGAFSRTSPETWYRKSLDALLHSERIEIAWDARYRRENAARGMPGLTSLPGKLYLELGRTYLRLGDREQALEAFERGHTLESNPDLLEELASLYQANGDPRRAAKALVEALAVDASRMQLTAKLVELYGQIDPGGCAVTRQGGSPGLNVDCPLVHADICGASRNVAGNYVRRGQHFEATAIRRIAMQDLGCSPDLLN